MLTVISHWVFRKSEYFKVCFFHLQWLADIHCVKNVRIRSYSGPYFRAFGLNTERYSVSFRIQSECGKIRTRTTSNMDTFWAVIVLIDISIIRLTVHKLSQPFIWTHETSKVQIIFNFSNYLFFWLERSHRWIWVQKYKSFCRTKWHIF